MASFCNGNRLHFHSGYSTLIAEVLYEQFLICTAV